MPDAPYRKTINEVVDDSHKNSAAHGFWDTEVTDETIPSKLALIMSEAAEALESYRDPASDEMVPVPEEMMEGIVLALRESSALLGFSQPSEFVQSVDDHYKKWKAKPKGFDIELADIVIRVGDLCGKLGIDLDAAIQKKHAYNLTRPMRHNRIV